MNIIEDDFKNTHKRSLRARLCSQFSTIKVRIAEIKFHVIGTSMFGGATFPRGKVQKMGKVFRDSSENKSL